MRAQILSLIVSFALAFAHADPVLEFRVPEAPATTPPPEAYLVRHRLLQARAAGANTCGWVNGIQTNSLTCSGSAQCAHNTLNTVFGCCSNLNDCYIPTVCFDSSLARALSVGGGPLTQICSGSQSYCQTYINDGGYYGFGCGTLAGEIFFLRSTYSGGSAVANSVAAVTGGSGSAASATAQAFNNVGGGVVTSLSGASIPSPTASSSSSGSSTSNTSTDSGSKLSTGAIVAIAVCGGLVVIAVIALIAFLVHKKHKKNKPSAVVYNPAPPQGPQGPPFEQQQGWQPPAGGNVHGQPMTQANMNQLHGAQGHAGGEWDFTKQGVAQYQTADNDGIKVTEIRPEEAVDERNQVMSQVGSTVAPTALAPTMVSHHPQGV